MFHDANIAKYFYYICDIMVDNFKLIRGYLSFNSPDDFYFLQIIQRKKDGPCQNGVSFTGNSNKTRSIKNYVITSIEYFDKIESEVKHFCDYFNARAMIILARKSFKNTALQNLVQSAEFIKNGQFENIKSSYWSACAKSSTDDRYFLIDIDEEDLPQIDLIKETIENKARNDSVPFGRRIKLTVPTKHGLHLITTPFDVRDLLSAYPKEKNEFIHTTGPTVLYIP